MKRTLFLSSVLVIGLATGATAQSNQSPTMPQSTPTEATQPVNPTKPNIRKPSGQERMNMEQALDTTQPKGRRQRRLPPDSLRRGGATKVDTVRR